MKTNRKCMDITYWDILRHELRVILRGKYLERCIKIGMRFLLVHVNEDDILEIL